MIWSTTLTNCTKHIWGSSKSRYVSKLCGSSMKHIYKSVATVFLQMTSSTREPKFLVVAGCLRGISALMINFTKTIEEGEMLCSI